MNELDDGIIQSPDADGSASNSLAEEDLEDVAGGATFGDIYDALNESWTDIKKGFVDAWND